MYEVDTMLALDKHHSRKSCSSLELSLKISTEIWFSSCRCSVWEYSKCPEISRKFCSWSLVFRDKKNSLHCKIQSWTVTCVLYCKLSLTISILILLSSWMNMNVTRHIARVNCKCRPFSVVGSGDMLLLENVYSHRSPSKGFMAYLGWNWQEKKN